MSDENLSLAGVFKGDKRTKTPVAFHAGRYYSLVEFRSAIAHWSELFNNQPFRRCALFTQDAYPFAVLLLAALHAGKEVWLPGNNLPGTADKLQKSGCSLIGDWAEAKLLDDCPASITASDSPLPPMDPAAARLILLTSGSTGEPKPVLKNLFQLETEINSLERQWGGQLGAAEVVSTVSHQHIYGLLFRVLWPLLAGRCFHSQTCLNPEMLVNSIHDHRPACWVASPAHLKRLDQDSPWRELARLRAIFSSGGVLPDEARQRISQRCGQAVIELYGSTETGGIAWKTHELGWTPFPGMSIRPDGDRWRLHSPYLKEPLKKLIPSMVRQAHHERNQLLTVRLYAPEGTELVEGLNQRLLKANGSYLLEDDITLLEDGRFLLNGRRDRIVKIEEKRLSLTGLERRLTDTPWIEQAFGLSINQHKQRVCVALVLTAPGRQELAKLGRSLFISLLKKQLEPWFEAVMLPRKWLFVNKIPLTAQGKIDSQLLIALLAGDKRKLPFVRELALADDQAELKLKVPQEHELVYFADHFQGHPILPGVVQLAWVEHFGKLLFAAGGARRPFSHLEVIKFSRIIRPGAEMRLTLKWNLNRGELQFNFSSGPETLSSGRMVYKKLPDSMN